jgi:hypothetical protein
MGHEISKIRTLISNQNNAKFRVLESLKKKIEIANPAEVMDVRLLCFPIPRTEESYRA